MNVRLLVIVGILIIVLAAGGIYLKASKKTFPVSPNNTQSQSTNQESTNSSASPSGSENMSETSIMLTSSGFNPSSVTIKAGTKLVWTNDSGAKATVDSDPHPIHTDYPPLNLGSFDDGNTLELTFDKPGTYHYHNHFNAAQRGTVVVE